MGLYGYSPPQPEFPDAVPILQKIKKAIGFKQDESISVKMNTSHEKREDPPKKEGVSLAAILPEEIRRRNVTGDEMNVRS